jgi:hypothetical protein
MKNQSVISLLIGLGLLVFAVYHFIIGLLLWAVIKLIIGGSLIYLFFNNSRTGLIVFGHMAILAGCLLLTAGIYYVPMIAGSIQRGNPLSLGLILAFPLFWGLISIFGGICAIYHGFCKCVRHEWKMK